MIYLVAVTPVPWWWRLNQASSRLHPSDLSRWPTMH
uniref:Uncharacterized protein n=1 Tax=Rhizophora mucronata TaxID=61149 RepID=A0A2P2NRV0_RHIMU